MPTYLYACRICGREIEEWKSIKDRHKRPNHCGKRTKRLINAPMVAPMFESYRAIGGDRRWIRNKQEHVSFLKEFNYEEVGNDPSMAPPPISDEEFNFNRQQQLAEVTESHQQQQQLLKDLAITPED